MRMVTSHNRADTTPNLGTASSVSMDGVRYTRSLLATAPYHKSGNRYIQYDISAVRATQKLYRTSLDLGESRKCNTVSFADRVSHPVDPPRPFLHVLRASGSARNGQSPPEHSNRPRMHWILEIQN